MLKRAAIAIALAIVVTGLHPAPQAEASSSGYGSAKEAAACVAKFGPSVCRHTKDAADWAHRVTVWKFKRNGHNDMSDAFRHCAWMGALATRVGSSRAIQVGDFHEDFMKPNPIKERRMDVANNVVGAGIGAWAVQKKYKDTWGYVLKECESKARNKRLYGLDGKLGRY